MASLRIYNTLSRTKENFEPVNPGKVGMYLCGPTVYKPAHIGHMVGPVIFDTVKRYLTYAGFDVTWIVNITDVDDKLINKATEKGMSVTDLAKEMTEDYLDNLNLMGVDTIDRLPYATEHIPEMLDMIGDLVKKDHAYPLNGDVYFRTENDDDYGKLSHRSIDEIMTGTRVGSNDEKHHPADFALWKGSKEGEPAWDSPWGPGRPGWHIECSAMSMKYLGETLDIHGGGLDLLFPHHENEMAQSECCTGKPFTKYWLHNGLMQASGQAGKVGGGHDRHGDAAANPEAQIAGKLAGSAGAESVKTAVFSKHHPETVRFFLLTTHYRSPIDFSDERIAEVGRSLDSFYRLIETFSRIVGDFYALEPSITEADSKSLAGEPAAFYEGLNLARSRFLDSMNDDFNTGGAVGVLFDLRKILNGFISDNSLEAGIEGKEVHVSALTDGMTLLKELAQILGVFRKPIEKDAGGDDELVGGLMELLITIRATLRKEKNWGLADVIRDSLAELNLSIEDRPDGTTWRKD
jgi:cysteinyl-tRNA synthetase